MYKKIGIITSGGDAQGMNACIRSVVRAAWFNDMVPYGIMRGYEGLINDDIQELNSRSVGNIIQRGGTVLKCARSEAFRTREGRGIAYDNYKKTGLDALVVIGGDGSLTGANLFHEEFGVPVIGIPATIDNDIYGTDFTIGFDTAANVALDAIDKIRDTADSHNRVFFIEVMGKNAGYLALQVGLASGAEIIMIPEILTTPEEVCKELNKSMKAGKTSHIVVVAEGNKSGNAYEIAKYVDDNFDQYDSKVAVLGHIQRGGSPSCNDRNLASHFGVKAINSLLEGESSVMVGVKDGKFITNQIKDVLINKNEISKDLIEVSNVLTKI